MSQIQQKLREIKAKSRLSQEALAREIGVSFPAFNAWWNGRSEPREKTLKKIDLLYAKYTAKSAIPSGLFADTLQKIREGSKNIKSIVATLLDRKDLLDNIIVKLTYHSDAIEGSTLTLKETAAVLFDNADIKNRTVMEQMGARNHKAAIMYLVEHMRLNKGVDENFIKQLHLILMNGILDTAGSYRSHGVRIAGTNVITANHAKVPDLMKRLAEKIAGLPDKDYIRSVARIHADFEKIHPFADGNGRVGRLLLNAMLLKKNVAPAIIEQNLKHLYYTYLETAQEKEDCSFLELFIAEAILKGFKEIQPL